MTMRKVQETQRTFCEVNVGYFVNSSGRIAEVFDQLLDRGIARCDQVDRLHGRQGFPFLVDIFHQGDALSTDIVHFAACRHHPHG